MLGIPVDSIPLGGVKLLSAEGRKIAVFHTAEGFFAVDNACPHEGYPLVQGDLAGCVLTCIWHNYKFDVRDGKCLMGEEDVDAFACRVADGHVHVDVPPPDPEAQAAKAWASLRQGLVEEQIGRVARDVARLLLCEVPPERIALEAALYDAARAQYGTTHALPVAAEVLRYLPDYPGVDATLPLMQAMELAARSNVRRPVRVRPEPEAPRVRDVAGEIRRRVEAEDAPGAEGLFRGWLAAGAEPAAVQALLFDLCADHFLDFGHGLIYVVKAFDLLKRARWEHADLLLGSLVFRIVNGTREDLLPDWAGWRKRMDRVEPRLDDLYQNVALTPPAWSAQRFHTRLVRGAPKDAFAALEEGLAEGVPVMDLVDALSLGAQERMLHLDLGHDPNPELQNGWLDVSHIVTFVNAVRHAVERWRDPRVLRLLFQAVRFVNHHRLLDGPTAPLPAIESTVDEVLGAILRQDVLEAMRRTQGCVDRATLWTALKELPLEDAATRPIFTAHLIKNAFAAEEEHAALDGDPRPLLALVRFFAAPKPERRLRRRVHEAVEFVVHGNIPKTLT